MGRGGINVAVGPRKPSNHPKPVVVFVPGYCHPYRTPYCPFDYRYAASDTQLHQNPNSTIFFFEKNLRPGAKMPLFFTKNSSPAATFLPRPAAESIPFSSEKLPEILSRLSVEPGSVSASAMGRTLKVCEEPPVQGEKRTCATSLESMIDFATASLATRHVRAVSTEVGDGATRRQVYTIAGNVERLTEGRKVACHPRPYVYPVFFCHVSGATRAYAVPLVGENGSKVEAIVVCHMDTSGWNPGHAAFKLLKVKRGTVPICHFLPQDHVVWASSD